MNAAQLKGMKRADLQKLCKERNIKGLTQKNEVLVKLLLESKNAPSSSRVAAEERNEETSPVPSQSLAPPQPQDALLGFPSQSYSTHQSELAQLRAEVDLLKPELYHALGQIQHLQGQLKASITADQCSKIVQQAVSQVQSDCQLYVDALLADLRAELTNKISHPLSEQEEEPVSNTCLLVLTPASEEGEAQQSVDISYADTIEALPSPSHEAFIPVLEPTSIPLPPSPSMPSIACSPDDTTLAHELPKQSTPVESKVSAPRTNSFFHQADQASPLAARTASAKQQTPIAQSVKSILGNPFSKTPQSAKRSSLPVTAATVAIAVTPAGPKTMYGTERDENEQFGDLENKKGAAWWPAWKA